MPLRCIDPTSNTSVHAFDLSLEEWAQLNQLNKATRHLRMPCCLSQVTLRTSPRDTRYFAHKKIGDCTSAPETEAHLRLKRMAVEIARASGWQAETEVTGSSPSGGQWQADVLARKGRHAIAIEIQWSHQTSEETLRRQARYAESGVRGLWLVRRGDFVPCAALPAARLLEKPAQTYLAALATGGAEQVLPVEELLGAAFGRRFKFGLPIGAKALASVHVGQLHCWKCGAETPILTRIGLACGPYRCDLSVAEFTEFPDLFASLANHIPPNLSVGSIKPRYSTAQSRSYLSNGCEHCGALIGEHFEHEAWEGQARACAFEITFTQRWNEALLQLGKYEPSWAVYDDL